MPLPIGPFPYQLINGTLADANQVMADFNWLLNGVNSLPWPLPGSQIANYNKLLNPFMEIDQANEGAATNPATNSFSIDGYRVGLNSTAGGVGAAQRQAAAASPLGYQNSLGYTTATGASSVPAGDYAQIFTRLEADDINDTGFGTSNAQALTLSFYAYCTIVGTYYVSFSNGAGTRSYITPYTISTASTWQLFSIAIPGDTAGTWTLSGNTTGFQVSWTLGTGTTYQTVTTNTWQSANLLGATGMSNAILTTTNAR